jgi:hypothetical protein
MKHSTTAIDGQVTVVTVLHDGELHTAIAEHHPNFAAILTALGDGSTDEQIINLFDVEKAVSSKFERLTERVTVRGGQVHFDGDVVDNSLTNQILRFLNEGEDDWEPLVYFMENVQQNPNANSRAQLFEWLANDESLTITDDGYIVGYKGCNNGSDGTPVSTRPAPASEQVTVDDVLVTGPVPQVEGSVVAMPRSVVDPAENNHCSIGLHVGTYRYAKSFAPVVLEVHVNPRDVVSVTSDSNREKIRTCRYEVVGAIEGQHTAPVIAAPAARKSVADTRENYKNQDRYPKGHPKAGQFKPKA